MVRLRSFLSCSVGGPARHDSNAALVDAAHAVDGDLLDEQLFFYERFFDSGYFWFGLWFHENPPGLTYVACRCNKCDWNSIPTFDVVLTVPH